MLTLYRRHKPTCSQAGQSRGIHNKCKCAIWADGVLGREEVRRSMRTRDWTKANQEVQRWEAAERVASIGARITLADAWTAFLADLEARKLTYETTRKYKALESQMRAWSDEQGLIFLDKFNLDTLSRFRQTWTDSPRTSLNKLAQLRAFFRFAHDRQWIESNPATKIKLPKVSILPMMPLSQNEMLKILAACDKLLITSKAYGKMGAMRLKTLVLLMRYSGMRISDAVTLTTDRLDGKRLFLYTQKTGVPVYTVLPDSVLRILEATPRVTGTRYFWTGNGKRQTAICDWQEKMKNLFESAGIPKGMGNAVSHRFRDTFAVELLLARVPIERVSILLGHQSVRITEKHYNPWVRSRQEQLEADVESVWMNDPVLDSKLRGTNQVQIKEGRPN